MRPIFAWTLDHPRITLVICALLSLVAGAGMLRLKEDTSPEAFLPRGHVSFDDKKYIDHTFDIHDSIVISIQDRVRPDVFNREALGLVQEVSNFVGNLHGVQSASVPICSRALDVPR